jgi:acyl carrier protein
MNIRRDLEHFLVNELAPDRRAKTIAPDEDLITQGNIDSVGLMQLVSFIESEFGITITDDDLVIDNFRTLRSIEDFILRKREMIAR